MEHITHSQVKLVRSLQQKKYRDELGLFVAEGEKCVGDLSAAFELTLRISEENATRTEIEQMSSLRTPQGVLGVFRRPSNEYDLSEVDPGKELVLVLDGIQDPGNLGTIIRTADWFGIRHIVCSRATADCYAPKVVQATMGSLARVRLHYTDVVAWLRTQKSAPIYGTLLDGKNMYQAEAIAAPRTAGIIAMGNEGNGLSAEVRALVTHPLFIPAYASDHAESLNVAIATAIVLAEFRRG